MWQVRVHALVLKEDFKSIPPFDQERILRVIQKKLSIEPKSYGKPLVGDYAGYWRLRIEDYRVVYKVVENEILVLVIKIGIRKDDQVYKELWMRLKKL